jgi:hypothetical protein
MRCSVVTGSSATGGAASTGCRPLPRTHRRRSSASTGQLAGCPAIMPGSCAWRPRSSTPARWSRRSSPGITGRDLRGAATGDCCRSSRLTRSRPRTSRPRTAGTQRASRGIAGGAGSSRSRSQSCRRPPRRRSAGTARTLPRITAAGGSTRYPCSTSASLARSSRLPCAGTGAGDTGRSGSGGWPGSPSPPPRCRPRSCSPWSPSGRPGGSPPPGTRKGGDGLADPHPERPVDRADTDARPGEQPRRPL